MRPAGWWRGSSQRRRRRHLPQRLLQRQAALPAMTIQEAPVTATVLTRMMPPLGQPRQLRAGNALACCVLAARVSLMPGALQ